jgi:hypothetical protein
MRGVTLGQNFRSHERRNGASAANPLATLATEPVKDLAAGRKAA